MESELTSAFGFAVLAAFLTGSGVFLVVLTVLHEIARWKGRFVSVWVTFFAALLILPILFGALIAGYSAFSEVDGSEALLPPAFWILIAAGGGTRRLHRSQGRCGSRLGPRLPVVIGIDSIKLPEKRKRSLGEHPEALLNARSGAGSLLACTRMPSIEYPDVACCRDRRPSPAQ